MTIQDKITPELERIKKELGVLAGMKIHVGIQGASGYDEDGGAKRGAPADLITIANIHEFGATIKAKNVKNLAIPIAKKARDKSPRDFPDLFFLEIDDHVYGCIDKGEHESGPSGRPKPLKPKTHKPSKKPIKTGKEDDIEFLFILMPSVSIPERSFIRAGYDSSKDAIEDAAARAIRGIIFEGWDAGTAANHIGMKIVGMIQEYMNTPSNFRNKSNITSAVSNSPEDPLFETGRLRDSVTYRVERSGG